VPIWATDSFDDVAATFLAEVDIDIRRFQAVFVQEPFEQQVVFDRANVAHVERVTNDRANARTTSRRGDVALASLIDEIPTDQEVVGKAQLVDHAKFAIESGLDDVREASVLVQHPFDVLVAIFQARFAEFKQSSFGRHTFRQIENGKVAFAKG